MILFLEFLTFFIYSRKVVLSNQRHDVTSDDTENLLPYRDILREEETEVHKGDTDLKEFFEYVAQSELYHSHLEVGMGQKKVLLKLWDCTYKYNYTMTKCINFWCSFRVFSSFNSFHCIPYFETFSKIFKNVVNKNATHFCMIFHHFEKIFVYVHWNYYYAMESS